MRLAARACAATRAHPGARRCHAIARRAVADGADLILVLGGDGTINEVVNGMVHSQRHAGNSCRPGRPMFWPWSWGWVAAGSRDRTACWHSVERRVAVGQTCAAAADIAAFSGDGRSGARREDRLRSEPGAEGAGGKAGLLAGGIRPRDASSVRQFRRAHQRRPVLSLRIRAGQPGAELRRRSGDRPRRIAAVATILKS